jgi:hypothetical protein
MFCVKCGTKNTEAAFCANCGTALSAPKRKTASKSSKSGEPLAVLQEKAKDFLQKPFGKPVAIGGGAFLVLLLILGTGVLSPNPLKTAYDDCGLDLVLETYLEDGDRTLTVDTLGEEDLFGASYFDYLCVLESLETPSRITTRMDGTSALDGQQTDSADGLTYFWKYHPDRGVQLTVTLD